MRYILLVLIGLLFSTLQAQEKVFSGPTKENIFEIVSVVNDETGDIVLLFFHSNGITADLFNSKLEKIKTLQSEGLPAKYESFIGYQFKGEKLSILMNTSNNRSYGFANFDFQNGSNSVEELDFKLKREFYLTTLSRNNQIYLVTAAKKNSQMNIYNFSGNLGEPSKKEVIVPEDTFIDLRFKKSIDFYDALYGGERSGTPDTPTMINNDLPTTIEDARMPLKIYSTKKGFSLTIDSGIDCTYIVDVSLEENQLEAKRFDYEKSEEKFAYRMKTNSYLFEGKLFQFNLNSDFATLDIFNIASGEKIKELKFERDETIKFANTPIIQLGGTFKDYRELETTDQFFRKSLEGLSDIGISVAKRDHKYELTFGNALEVERGSYYYVGGGAIGGAIGGGLMALANELVDYRNTKSVYFTGKFSEDFDHVSGKVDENILDKIVEFSEDLSVKSETLFSVGDHYYYVYFNRKLDAYFIHQF